MATRKSIDEYLQSCTDVIHFAQEQYVEAAKQEHVNTLEYTEAMQKLEMAYKEMEILSISANDQQKEELYRMRLQLQAIQNEMILQDK